MKLISLNTWAGRAGSKNLLGFFKKYKDIDIFCLQEIWHSGPDIHDKEAGGKAIGKVMRELFKEIGDVLTNHRGYFRPHYQNWYGLAIFSNKNVPPLEEGDVFVYKRKGYEPTGDLGNHARNIQYLKFESPSGQRAIINFHGLWNGRGKTDSKERLAQSTNIVNFIKTLETPYLIAGDFNLLPDTESLKMLEDFRLKNLIKEFGITSTRTSFYDKPAKYADYILTSKEIKIKDFKVLPDEVSDHLPLYLEFE